MRLRGMKAALQKWTQGAFSENLIIKLVCLLVSLGFFAYLHGAQNVQRSFSLSVTTSVPPEGDERVLMVDLPSTARVTLTGSRLILDDLKSDELGVLQIDPYRARDSYAVLDLSRLRVPPGIKVEVDPQRIPLSWDAMVTRLVPVQIPLTGQPERGFVVQGAPVPEPSVVSVQGPQTLVELIQAVRTEPFDIERASEEGVIQRKLPLDMPPSRVIYQERSVLATVTLGQARSERLFKKVAVQVVGVSHATVLPSDVDVRVVGPPDFVEELRSEQVVPIADVHSMAVEARKGSASVPILVVLEGCSVQVVPPTVVVKW